MRKAFLLSIVMVLISYSISMAAEIKWNPIPIPNMNTRSFSSPSTGITSKIPVYDASNCTGSIVNGRCMGTINSSSPPKYCYGQMINGTCTGHIGNY